MKKYMDLEDMANVNCSNVLNIIQKNGTVSRNEITQISGLSWGGMTKIVNKLLEHEYITEVKLKQNAASGRTPRVLSVNTVKNFVIGLDINKTGLKAIVSDLTGKTLRDFSRAVTATCREQFLSEIIDFISDIFSCFEKDTIISMGIAMQGTVDCQKGISVKFPDMEDWAFVPLKGILEERFGVSVFVEHDPDCLLYPHIMHKTRENTVLLRIDQSIGMAVAIDGKIIKGTGIFEIAHNTVIPNGKECHCGCPGCMEAYIRPCMIHDTPIPSAIEELLLPLALTVKNMSGIFHADKVILTGALMEHHDLFKHKLRDILADLRCQVNVVFSEVSDFAVQGAALIAVDKSINSLLM